MPATVSDDPDLPYVELDGYKFHVETFRDPDKRVVVVLHGGPRRGLPLPAWLAAPGGRE